MSRIERAVLTATAMVFLAIPAGVEAQSSSWWEWALRDVAEARGEDPERDGPTLGDIIFGRDGADRDDRGDRDDDDDRYEDRGRAEDRARSDRGRDRAGPPFCRNGRGHPVHGLEWCRDKGFGTGTARSKGGVWERERGWEDIILDAPRDGDRRRDTVDQGGLIDVLGDIVFGRIDGQRLRMGGTAPLEGRWLDLRDGGRVLQFRSGSVPVAELTDLDGDGRVDVALSRR